MPVTPGMLRSAMVHAAGMWFEESWEERAQTGRVAEWNTTTQALREVKLSVGDGKCLGRVPKKSLSLQGRRFNTWRNDYVTISFKLAW